MRQTRLLMGMPITVEIVDATATQKDIDSTFNYFQKVDAKFSTYKENSEISQFNRGEIQKKDLSKELKEIFSLSKETRRQTGGYFNITQANGVIDPSGLVKGWAIWEASKQLLKKGFENFYIDAGGDIQVAGFSSSGKKWKIGIKNPFNEEEIVKRVCLTSQGIATSGTYIRGQHVYNPHNPNIPLETIVSFTVIGPNVYEADRFATACFAMQEKGIYFLEKQKGLEGYAINKKGIATFTSGFEKYIC